MSSSKTFKKTGALSLTECFLGFDGDFRRDIQLFFSLGRSQMLLEKNKYNYFTSLYKTLTSKYLILLSMLIICS